MKAISLLIVAALLPILACARVRSFGPRGHLIDPKLHAGKVNAVAQHETLAWEYELNVSIVCRAFIAIAHLFFRTAWKQV